MAGDDFRFPPEHRLKKPAEFKKVFTQPTKSSDQYFTLLAVKNDLGYSRLGLAIAKKVVKKAVDRNRLKRTIREHYRMQQQLGSLDIVVLARKEALDAPLVLLQKSLAKHWLKLISRCV